MSGPQRSKGEIELEQIDRVFKALAHSTRRHILLVLHARGGRMTAGDIAARFGCAWATTSRHLKSLQAAGLVRVERSGRERYYALDLDRLQRIGGGWFEWFGRSRK